MEFPNALNTNSVRFACGGGGGGRARTHHDMLGIDKWENYVYDIRTLRVRVYTLVENVLETSTSKSTKVCNKPCILCSRIFVSFHSCVVWLLNCLLVRSFDHLHCLKRTRSEIHTHAQCTYVLVNGGGCCCC